MFRHTLEFSSLGLTPLDILHEMGYRKVMPGEAILNEIYTLFSQIEALVEPSCAFRLFDGEIENTSLLLQGEATFEVGSVISNLLAGSTSFALFAATAGEAFQQFQEKVSEEDDMLPIFILDIIGTCIAEKAGDRMELLLEEITGLFHTHRFSPGYCGWSLTEQKQLFALLGNNPCGITLSDVCLMNPIKSISGIIGIGETVNVKQYGCQFCELETCYKRKDRK